MRTGTVSYKLEDLRKGVIIPIGMVGENDFTRVIFDAEEVFKKHPDAQVTMKVQPPKGGIYPATVTRDGNAVIWQVKAADVAHKGSGEIQLTFTADTMVEKSYIARTDIKRSLVGNGPAPDPVQDWVDNAEEVLEDLEAAEVHQPTIGNDGYWYRWDAETGEYVTTGTKAQGQDGHSPVLTSSKSGKTTTIYADGTQLAQIQDGEDGQGADVIDDTAGEGDTDKTWSANKLDTEITDVKNDIQGAEREIQGIIDSEYNAFGILPLKWEKGDINKSTGAETGTTNIRTLFVKVSPSTQYRVYTLNSKSWKYCQYSTNNVSGFISGHGAYSGNNITITTASTANYLRFVVTCSPADLNEANYIIVVNDDDLQSIGRTFINENNSAISSNDTFESLSKMKLNRRYQVSGSVMAQYSDSPSTKSVNAVVAKLHGATKSGLNYIQIVLYMDNTIFYRTTTNGGTSWTSWTEIFSYYDMKSVMSEIVLSSAQKKILLLGDSITQGVGSTGIVHFTDANDIVVWGNAPDYPSAGTGYVVGDHIYDLSNIRRYYEAIDGSGWAQKFKAYCEGKFNCIVKNYGMSGINSRVLLDYLSQTTYPVPGYDIAIVMIGTNDRYESANIPKATSYSNICSIVDKLREHGTKVILMAATPATTVDEENASARVYHMDDVDHIIMKVASDKRVPFISLFSAMNDYCLFTGTTLASLLNNDGLHPNDTGYAVMYRLILRELGIPKRDDVQ